MLSRKGGALNGRLWDPRFAEPEAQGKIAAEPLQEQKASPNRANKTLMVAVRNVSMCVTRWGRLCCLWHCCDAVKLEL